MDPVGQRSYLGETRQELQAIRDRADAAIRLIDLLAERGPGLMDPIDLAPEVARLVRGEERVRWIGWARGMLTHLEIKLAILVVWWRRTAGR